MRVRVAILTKQIGHYHDARYRGAAAYLDDFVVISVVNQAEFAEFLARDAGDYRIIQLFSDRAQYGAAVTQGAVSKVLCSTLALLMPDVIAVEGWASPESFVAIAWARRMRRRVVVMSESQPFDATRSWLREAIKRRIVNLCDAALVGGPTHRDYVESLGMPNERIHFGYNVVDNAHFKAGAAHARAQSARYRTALGLPDRYILASARFIEKKNLPTLVRAYARVRVKVPTAPDLVILGDGPDRGAVESVISECNLNSCVQLAGFRSYELLPVYYGLAEGFAHVSLVEQWGLVVNEAMAVGAPVLVSNTCGVAQALVKDGVNGFRVNPKNVGDIAQGLTRLIALDKLTRCAIGNAGQRTISEWGPDRFGFGLQSAARSAMSGPERPGLNPWDAAMISYMERRTINAVS